MNTKALARGSSGGKHARELNSLASQTRKMRHNSRTAEKVLIGFRLRAIREYYFGPRNPNGGRPKKTGSSAGLSWESMLASRIGLGQETAGNWMRIADAVEQLAVKEGSSLHETCGKLPWDWEPVKKERLVASIDRLIQDKTMRELLHHGTSREKAPAAKVREEVSAQGVLNLEETASRSTPKSGLGESHAEDFLSKRELQKIRDLFIKPFYDAWESLCA